MLITVTEPAVATFSHMVHSCPTSLLHLANDRPMHYQLSLFGLGRLTHWPKFIKRGDDLLPTEVYHPAKFHCPASTYVGDITYKKS